MSNISQSRVSRHFLYAGKSFSVPIRIPDIGPSSRILFQFQRTSEIEPDTFDAHGLPIYPGSQGGLTTGEATAAGESSNQPTIIQLMVRAIGSSVWIPANSETRAAASNSAIQALTDFDGNGNSWTNITNGELTMNGTRERGRNIGLGPLDEDGTDSRSDGDNVFSTVADVISNTEIQVRKVRGSALDMFVVF